MSSFPFHTLQDHLLLEVLSKMRYQDFIACRQSSRWLHYFIEENRRHIRVKHVVEHLCFEHKAIGVGRYGLPQLNLPDVELSALVPKRLHIYDDVEYSEVSRIISLMYKNGWFRAKIYLTFISKNVVMAFLDEMERNGLSEMVDITAHEESYGNDITTHNLFMKIKNIRYNDNAASPDLSFLLEHHGKVEIKCDTLSNWRFVSKAIQMICDGLLQTTSLVIHPLYNDNDYLAEFLATIPKTFVWSNASEDAKKFKITDPILSCLTNTRDLEFYTCPVKGKNKIGSLCISTTGTRIVFNLHKRLEEFYVKRQ